MAKYEAESPKKPPGKSGIMIVVRTHNSSKLATLSSCFYPASCKDETKSSESHGYRKDVQVVHADRLKSCPGDIRFQEEKLRSPLTDQRTRRARRDHGPLQGIGPSHQHNAYQPPRMILVDYQNDSGSLDERQQLSPSTSQLPAPERPKRSSPDCFEFGMAI
ncbi:hypothetical protein TTRE_0000863801 [Trichuris trichiura]|uniref:Uncharacterized protein n=1 Tax=Trichuris trichiura TaxID=36087 RepID=A0A077ZKQ2_TRITR|nr:hypothetical protein TTRE_0000863801 [Trichuris trichiura]